ncbi:hypothetical protein ACF3NR_08730 [Vaginella massiliensis]|uniref:hypothetical protein n=1 Tax=Vaginella massiliensis TaxID=1816680 RepID=UPI0008383863|nr:hypothetical protein [Vaginella massiliensis]
MKLIKILFIISVLLLVSNCKKSKYKSDELHFYNYMIATSHVKNVMINGEYINPYDSALFYLNKMEKSHPDQVIHDVYKLKLFILSGQYKLAYEMENNTESFSINFLKGIAYARDQQLAKSNQYFRSALEIAKSKKDEIQTILVQYYIDNDIERYRKSMVKYDKSLSSFTSKSDLTENLLIDFNHYLYQ